MRAEYRIRKLARVLGNLFKSNIGSMTEATYFSFYYHILAVQHGSLKSIRTLKSFINEENIMTEEIDVWVMNFICFSLSSSSDPDVQCGVAELATVFVRKYGQSSQQGGKEIIERTMKSISKSKTYDKKVREYCEKELKNIEKIPQPSRIISSTDTILNSIRTE